MSNHTVAMHWRELPRLALCSTSRLPAWHDHEQCRQEADRAIAACHDTIDGRPDSLEPAA